MKRVLPLAVLLTACGQVPGLQYGQSSSMQALANPASQIEAEMQQAVSQLTTLSGQVTYTEIDLQGQSHTSVASFETDITHRWIRAHIDQSDNSEAQGADMLSLDNGQITVKVHIAFFPVTKTFSETDPKVCSARGYTIPQTDFVAMVDEIEAPQATLTYLGQQSVLGQTVDLLDVTPSGLPDCAHEHVGLDPSTHLPVLRQAFSKASGGQQDVFDASVANPVLNPQLPSDTWQL